MVIVPFHPLGTRRQPLRPCVIDSGRGIPPEDQGLIFEKFRSGRRSALDDPTIDAGFGLPFCKLAVERTGGRIALTSHPGETVFAVTLSAFPDEKPIRVAGQPVAIVPDRRKGGGVIAAPSGTGFVWAMCRGWQGICRNQEHATAPMDDVPGGS